MFATKPELAGQLLARAHERAIRAAFAAGDAGKRTASRPNGIRHHLRRSIAM